MKSVKTINNQNAITDAILGLDGNSNTIINGSLTVQDSNSSLVITPSGVIPPTNTTINNITVNGTITQNNTGTNIDQTDHTNNINANNLRATTIYGDLNLKRPTGAQGGAIRLLDVLGSGNSMQLYQQSTTSSIIGLAPGGITNINQRNAANTNYREVIKATTTGTTISQSATDSQTQILMVTEIDTSKTIALYPNSLSGSNNPVIVLGDNQIICYGGASNTQSLVVGVASNQSNGLKINSVANTTTIGQGGSGGNFITSFSCNGTNSTINGPAIFSSTTPPTSSQTLPASTDSSTNIPTTAWVQSAISNNIPLYFKGYKFMVNPSLPFTTTPIGNLTINFTNGASLKINDSFTIRFSIRYDYNDASSTAQSLFLNTYYGNLIVYPNRVITNSGSVPAYLNGTLNGSTAYTYNNATFAPNGRYFWTENYSSSLITDATNNNPNPISITTINQTSLTLVFSLPYNSTGVPNSNCSLSVFLELINNCNPTQTTITTTATFFDSVQKTF